MYSAKRRFPGCNCIVLRRTFAELEKSVIDHYLKYVHPHRKALGIEKYYKSNHSVVFKNGSTLFFGHCENEKDVYQYQGDEFLFIGFDEISHFTYRMWDFMKSRNRCPVKGSRPNMAGATNPCGPGIQWLRKLFHEKAPAPGMGEDTYNPDDYDCIQTTVFDNPTYANDENYISGLRSLAPDLRAQMLEGAWDVISGQYFDMFSPDQHVRGYGEIPFQAWQKRWISIDWAYAPSWTVVYWHTIVTLNEITGAKLNIAVPKGEKLDVVSHAYREAKFQECGYLPRTCSGNCGPHGARPERQVSGRRQSHLSVTRLLPAQRWAAQHRRRVYTLPAPARTSGLSRS